MVSKTSGAAFCVQKHLASHLHYDFRLEHRGVLLSWAVPKGPSLNTADKRMAVHVEDHPVDYGDFEGAIPSGYGAGIVMLWDRGTWTPDPATPDVDAALTKGELKFSLDGVKLKGSWVLVRTRRGEKTKGPEQWLLMKHRDRWAGAIDVTDIAPQSVKSFGDLPDILAAHGLPPGWTDNPPVRGGDTGKLLADVIRLSKKTQPAGPETKPKRAKSSASPKPTPKAKTTPTPTAVHFGKNRPALTNQQKILYPKTGFTKGDLVNYYSRVAPLILPHLIGRAVTLKRFPDGVEGKSFFEKRCASHRPDWVKTVRVHGRTESDKTIDYCMIGDLSTLVWAANLAAIELHVPLALAAYPDRPTTMVFDLDPGEPATTVDCCRLALRLKSLLDDLKLKSVVKTSGGKGLHILVPLNTARVTFDQTKSFARAIALTLEKDDPKRVIASMARAARGGKVFVDWSQNDRNKTTAGVFSVRAREVPSVSWPIDWTSISVSRAPAAVLATDDFDPKSVTKLMDVMSTVQSLPRIGNGL